MGFACGSTHPTVLQILTVEQLMTGARAELPIVDSTAFRRAKREENDTQEEMEL
jgi:hypothetical protein